MAKRQKIKEGFTHAANAAKDKLADVLAAGIVATDPLDDKEKRMLAELIAELTPEQGVELLNEVGADPYAHGLPVTTEWGHMP